MPSAADKARADMNCVVEFFSQSKSAKRVKGLLDPVEKIVALLEANPRLIYIDFFSLYKTYPDVPIEFIQHLLSKRSDLDKSQTKEIIEGIKEKVQEESERTNGKGAEIHTIFSKVNMKA